MREWPIRTVAAELRYLVKWAIELRKKGFNPEDSNPIDYMKKELKKEVKSWVLEEVAKYEPSARDDTDEKKRHANERRT